jgi:hypothetical protein
LTIGAAVRTASITIAKVLPAADVLDRTDASTMCPGTHMFTDSFGEYTMRVGLVNALTTEAVLRSTALLARGLPLDGEGALAFPMRLRFPFE